MTVLMMTWSIKTMQNYLREADEKLKKVCFFNNILEYLKKEILTPAELNFIPVASLLSSPVVLFWLETSVETEVDDEDEQYDVVELDELLCQAFNDEFEDSDVKIGEEALLLLDVESESDKLFSNMTVEIK